MSCPKCGSKLELDPDGGYCPECDEYWDERDLEEKLKEEE